MAIRLRTLFFFLIGVLLLWFFYVERSLLSPVIIGGIFAYIFNPVVNFFSDKLKLSRGVAVIIVYIVLMSITVALSTLLARALMQESSEIHNYATSLLVTTKTQIHQLPDWLRPTARDLLIAVQRSKIGGSLSLLPFFPQAISRIVSFFIFLMSGYYFLKEGNTMFDRLLNLVPKRYKIDLEILLRKINIIFAKYLRGQLFLILLMGIATFIPLTILGVRFSVLLAVFSGFAEIIPIVGPITAAGVSIFIVLITGHTNFGLVPMDAALIIALIYFILRYAEDYLVIPHVMGKITQLPPFIIFFAVIAGGHLFGILGLILAVPVAGIIRILLEFSLEHLNKIS